MMDDFFISGCHQCTAIVLCVKYTDVCLRSKTIKKIGCFNTYLFVIDYNHFHVVFTFCQKLNLRDDKYNLTNVQKYLCCFTKLFS